MTSHSRLGRACPSVQRAGKFASAATIIAILAGFYWAGELLRENRGHNGGSLPPARLAALGRPVKCAIRCRTIPVRISPDTSLRHVVTDEEVLCLLCSAVPTWNPPTIPSLIHELKLWGRNAQFTEEMRGGGYHRRGSYTVDTLLNETSYRANTVNDGGNFLFDSPYGIRVALHGSPDGTGGQAEGHLGQLLKALGESGVPSTTSVSTASGRTGTVADILQDSVMRFSMSQELEFVGCALALWIPPENTWTDEFGVRYDFDMLVKALCSVPLGRGSCGGCHVAFTIVTILRVDEIHPVLTKDARDKSMRWLRGLAALLEKRQCPDGGWDKSWAGTSEVGFILGDPIQDFVTITGHHLEWIALAPQGIRPSDETVRRAVHALARQTAELLEQRRSFKALLPASHAARALCWMRGVDPYETFARAWQAGRLRTLDFGPKPSHL